ncbi:ATP-binding protein [Magnetospira sp. QH-2]|uniref:sensor histidine kinase n=1 Tax=Magnetospira sp. (strain QH-2) TaxID=1288970 RepID=UPI0003E80BDC|nr:ATP-binding protein [Magnetospira sp. QH-2]CCQ73264.1 Putative two-component sensor histidine kinase protein [Magnetospira sp. QH-2]
MSEPTKQDQEFDWPEVPKFVSAPQGSVRAKLTFIFATVVTAAVVMMLVSVWIRATALKDMEAKGHERLATFVENLRSELDKYAYLPVVLSRNQDLTELLLAPEDLDGVDHVNRALESINRIAATSAVYLMNGDGLTIAASNWNSDRPFVGKNFNFRPYFQDALRGETGRYFALGTTSNKPGYYLSYPVKDETRILGVVVVKIGMERLETAWAASESQVLVTDKHGIAFISSRPDWRFKTLETLPPGLADHIRISQQYGTNALTPLQIEQRVPAGESGEIMTIRTEETRSGKARFFVQSLLYPETGWTLHLMSDVKAVDRIVYGALAAAAFTLVVFAFFAYTLFQRRLRLWERVHYQRKARAALQQAYDQLEKRIEARTADLRHSNQALHREIQERRKTESTLRTTQAEMVHACKLAALGQMSAGITHELNQPLTAIRTYADNAHVLLDRDRLDDVRGNLSQISDLTNRMATITGDLKTFARKPPDEVGPVDLRIALHGALSLLTKVTKTDGLEITDKVPSGCPMVVGEELRLEQVFLNLFRNALDAMDGMEKDQPRRLGIDAEITDEQILVLIHDSGPGLTEEDLEKVFDPFYTTKAMGKGLGLGLSISDRIINDFGGSLRVSNHPDGGALFTVALQRDHGNQMAQTA